MCSDIQLDNLTTRKLNVSITFANKLLSNKGHPTHSNGKCVHAIANINRVYDELLEKNDFL